MGRWIGLMFLYLVAGFFAQFLFCPFVGWGFWGVWLPVSFLGGSAAALLSDVDSRERSWLKQVTIGFYVFPVAMLLVSITALGLLWFMPHGLVFAHPLLAIIPGLITIGIIIGTGGSIIGSWKELGHGPVWSKKTVQRELDMIKNADLEDPVQRAKVEAIIARGEARRHGGGHH